VALRTQPEIGGPPAPPAARTIADGSVQRGSGGAWCVAPQPVSATMAMATSLLMRGS
jgi:hypothetical protein